MKGETVFLDQNGAPLFETEGILPVEKGVAVEIRDEEGKMETLQVRGSVLALSLWPRQADSGIATIRAVVLRVALGPLE